ncbi:MAG: ASPIC/UnbV domain-containing protein [Verrucomicrobia bacterium]|nr:ASPIC/UnbV domain-containing protein [Verrucomicrobiota bacterium]
MADLDQDGDLDVIVNKLNEQAGVYRNQTAAPRLAVRLRGPPANRQGIGAKVVVEGGPVRQSQEFIAGGHYLSGADPLRVFATGSPTNLLRIEVTWRDGRRSVVPDARPNRLYELDYTGAVAVESEPAPARTPHFADVSDRLGHRHHEDPFDDFARQPLLPQRLSQLGPGVAWHDFDGDGWEDLIIGSGRGGVPGFFRNDQRGGFAPCGGRPLNGRWHGTRPRCSASAARCSWGRQTTKTARPTAVASGFTIWRGKRQAKPCWGR